MCPLITKTLWCSGNIVSDVCFINCRDDGGVDVNCDDAYGDLLSPIDDMLLGLNLNDGPTGTTDCSDTHYSTSEVSSCDVRPEDTVPGIDSESVDDAAAAPSHASGDDPIPSTETERDWQAVVEDLMKTIWPNDNWKRMSRLFNIISCSDADADVILDTIRNLNWTVSLPSKVTELRQLEIAALGTNK